ncbi:MAG: glycosyltransferase, partial [Ilumatobacteraceae bacterium]
RRDRRRAHRYPRLTLMHTASPFVRVVVLNFDGGQMTMDCLASVMASDWPADRFEIVMVDNGSLDDVVERVRDELPGVRVIEPMANTGFAAGCNLGIRAPGDFDLVALVNNDATVDPGWLRPLVEAVHADRGVGAASPKMLFDGRFVEVDVRVDDAARIGADPRTLGVRLTAARIDGTRADDRLAFDEGFFPPEAPVRKLGEELARWSWRRGLIRVRIGSDGRVPQTLSLRLAAIEPRNVHLVTDRADVPVFVADQPRWVDVTLGAEPFDVVNNAGSALYPNGFGGDRGFLEADRGQFDEPAEVFAWCGGAVVMRREYLDDVGLFDERLFLYYEDTDLSWRGRLRGWRYVFVPDSVVRHRHAQSSGVGSPVFRYFTERNRPLVLVKNAPAAMAWRAGAGLGRRAISSTVRGVVLRPLTMRMPMRADAAHHWRIFAGYLRLVPGMLRDRWRARPAVARSELLRWEQHKETAA